MTDEEWGRLAPYVPPILYNGPQTPLHPRREICDAIFYVDRTGCQWRNLPRDVPPWKTVYHYFRKWRRSGSAEVFERPSLLQRHLPSVQRWVTIKKLCGPT